MDSTPPPNTLPVADAGADRSVQVDNSITIIGSGSDSDGMVTYEWKMEGNSTVLATTASFDYTPNTVGVHTLTLTVTDNDDVYATDSMYVAVTAEPVPIDEIIVDNLDAGFSTTGTWSESIATDSYAGISLYSMTVGSSTTWRPNMPETGSYEVHVWYSGSQYGNRDTSADYTVNYAGDSQTIAVDQDQGSGAWVTLGTFFFNAGNNGNVTLVYDSADSSKVAIADAVRFVFSDGTP